MRSIVTGIVGALALAAAAWVPSAHASGTITQTAAGQPYVYQGSSGADVLTISAREQPIINGVLFFVEFTSPTTITLVTVDPPGPLPPHAPEDCSPTSGPTITCRPDSLEPVFGNGNAGNDQVRFDDGSVFPPCLGCESIPTTFTGGTGVDELEGSNVADLLEGGPGGDTITGGPGNDVLNGDDDVGTTIDDGADRINGGSGNDDIDGQGASDPELDGEAGNDEIAGGSGDDTISGGPENDTVNGGAGAGDRIAYNESGRVGGVVVDLSDGTSGSDGGSGETSEDAIGFEHVTGSAAADEITGDGQANLLDGGGGDDQVMGGDGNDMVSGGTGADDLAGGGLNDVLLGGAGADEFDGGSGSDTVSYDEPGRTAGVTVTVAAGGADDGSTFDDGPGGVRDSVPAVETVQGSSFADTLVGDALASQLLGGGGDDVLQGGLGGDVLRGEAGADTVSFAERTAGQPISVTLDGAPGDGAASENDDVGMDIENARGGAGADTLTGGDGANVLEGGDGSDLITGGGAVDTFRAGPGDDAVRALDGNVEPVDCGAGNADRVEADAGDQVTGCERRPPVDADADGFASDVDCDDSDPSRFPTAMEVLDNGVDENCDGILGRSPPPDRDADGFDETVDCDDLNRSIRPGAVEIPGNDVDENCDDRRPDFPLIGASISILVKSTARSTRITGLTITGIPPGGRVELRCRPPKAKRRACPFRRVRRSFARGRRRVKLVRAFERRRLPRGTVIEVRVLGPEVIGKVRLERIGRGKTTSQVLCLRPGARRRARCPNS